MIEPRYLNVRTKRARYTKEVEREDGNMSITRSISVAQTDDRFLKQALQETNKAIDLHQREDSNMSITPTMIMPRHLSVRTKGGRGTRNRRR